MNETQIAQPSAAVASRPARGLSFQRFFTTPGVSPYDQVAWELRDAVIQDWKGKLIFEQKNVEVPCRLVDDRDQHRRQQVSARPRWNFRA